MNFAGCNHETSKECPDCKGTGRRGAKKNGKKLCRRCEGDGTLTWCEKHDAECPIEACKTISY